MLPMLARSLTEARGLFRVLMRKIGRVKERLLGRSDRTIDEVFEEHLKNFSSQETKAARMQRDVLNYIRCLKGMQGASHVLMETLGEVYGHDLLFSRTQNSGMLWADLAQKLQNEVLVPLNRYQAQFPAVRRKIEKRGRKLIDYDKVRHDYAVLSRRKTRKKEGDVEDKELCRKRVAMEKTRRIYDALNEELHSELPALLDHGVDFFVKNMQTLFAAEKEFHEGTAKICGDLETVAKEVQRGSLPRKILLPKPGSQRSGEEDGDKYNNYNDLEPLISDSNGL